jgi:hypothetical protein
LAGEGPVPAACSKAGIRAAKADRGSWSLSECAIRYNGSNSFFGSGIGTTLLFSVQPKFLALFMGDPIRGAQSAHYHPLGRHIRPQQAGFAGRQYCTVPVRYVKKKHLSKKARQFYLPNQVTTWPWLRSRPHCPSVFQMIAGREQNGYLCSLSGRNDRVPIEVLIWRRPITANTGPTR